MLVSTHYMDEAERCHRLAYIAYGAVLSTGTVEEVVAAQHLATWVVSGPDLAALEQQLRGRPGVDQVTPFGATLHVVGPDSAALEAAIEPYRRDERYHWQPGSATLEDVFIHLMEAAPDNYQ